MFPPAVALQAASVDRQAMAVDLYVNINGGHDDNETRLFWLPDPPAFVPPVSVRHVIKTGTNTQTKLKPSARTDEDVRG